MRSLISLIVLLTAMMQIAYARESLSSKSFEIKGIRLGVTIDELNAQFPTLGCKAEAKPQSQCFYFRTSAYQPNVTELNTIAEQLVDVWNFHFINGRLGLVSVTFKEEDYVSVMEAFKVKYGPPQGSKSRTLQNRMGASFTSRDFQWRSTQEDIESQQYFSDLNTSSIRMSSKDFIKQWRAIPDDQTTRRAKDL